MKQEYLDILKTTPFTSAPWGVWAFFSGMTIAEWLAVAAFILQTLYLLRKWWREETEAGLRMKRLMGKKPTDPDTEPAKL